VIDGGRAWQERRDRPGSHSRACRLRCITPPLVGARNLAPLPADVDFTMGASAAMPGLTAWQGLVEHGRLAGQSVLVHGAAGAVGSMVTQLARESGA
jgi:NADPH:quinone reductase-like Zn-dependent oxidoreductase